MRAAAVALLLLLARASRAGTPEPAGPAPLALGRESLDPSEFSPVEREERVAAIAVKFQDSAGTPYSIDDVRRAMDGVARYYREASYGRVLLRRRVFGWFRMSIPESCDKQAVKKAANEAALGRVPLEAYTRIVFFAPRQDCRYDAFALSDREPVTVEKRGGLWPDRKKGLTVAWINGRPSPHAVLHELGHNMGLMHASVVACDRPPLAGNCVETEYEDPYDAMGARRPGHFNVYEKERLGWIAPGEIQDVPQAPGSYRYELAPLEDKGGLKGLRFPARYRGAAVAGYLEHRREAGAQLRIVVERGEPAYLFRETHLVRLPGGRDALAAGETLTLDDPRLEFVTKAAARGALEVVVRVGDPAAP